MAENLVGMAFIPYYRQLMEILETNKELRNTVRGSLMQGVWAGVGTLLGGLVRGRVGALLGGLAGLLLGYSLSSDYDSLLVVMRNLSDEDKQKLVHKVQKLVKSASIDALTRFIGIKENREALLKLLRSNKSGW